MILPVITNIKKIKLRNAFRSVLFSDRKVSLVYPLRIIYLVEKEKIVHCNDKHKLGAYEK